MKYFYNNTEYTIEYDLFNETDDTQDIFLVNEEYEETLYFDSLPFNIQNDILELVINERENSDILYSYREQA